MGFGLVIIGDELLSGKRRDRHFATAIELLRARGLSLVWSRIIGDEPELIAKTLRDTYVCDDIVFCYGGLGATPDDHTRAVAARAAQVPLVRHPEAVAEIEARFGADAYPHRITMADLPQGSCIIPNPYNRIPGFSLGDHHFLPGFPEMAAPMLEWVLDQCYAHLRNNTPPIESSFVVINARESELLELMEDFVARFPSCRFSCLPQLHREAPTLEWGVRGAQSEVEEGVRYLQAQLAALGYRWEAQR